MWHPDGYLCMWNLVTYVGTDLLTEEEYTVGMGAEVCSSSELMSQSITSFLENEGLRRWSHYKICQICNHQLIMIWQMQHRLIMAAREGAFTRTLGSAWARQCGWDVGSRKITFSLWNQESCHGDENLPGTIKPCLSSDLSPVFAQVVFLAEKGWGKTNLFFLNGAFMCPKEYISFLQPLN